MYRTSALVASLQFLPERGMNNLRVFNEPDDSIPARVSQFKVIQSRKVGRPPVDALKDKSAGNLDAHREGRRLAQVLEMGC